PAAIPKLLKSSTNRSERSNRTCIAPCAFCAVSSDPKSAKSCRKEPLSMRCREVEALWDDIREGMPPLRAAVHNHLRACQRCQDLYEQYEGVAYCLSCLPQPEPSCNLAKRVIEHIATLQN